MPGVYSTNQTKPFPERTWDHTSTRTTETGQGSSLPTLSSGFFHYRAIHPLNQHFTECLLLARDRARGGRSEINTDWSYRRGEGVSKEEKKENKNSIPNTL